MFGGRGELTYYCKKLFVLNTVLLYIAGLVLVPEWDPNTIMYATGLVLVPEWDAKTEIDLQSVIVEEVKDGSEAERKGICRGDEVVLINDKSVMELGWVEVERLMSGNVD